MTELIQKSDEFKNESSCDYDKSLKSSLNKIYNYDEINKELSQNEESRWEFSSTHDEFQKDIMNSINNKKHNISNEIDIESTKNKESK